MIGTCLNATPSLSPPPPPPTNSSHRSHTADQSSCSIADRWVSNLFQNRPSDLPDLPLVHAGDFLVLVAQFSLSSMWCYSLNGPLGGQYWYTYLRPAAPSCVVSLAKGHLWHRGFLKHPWPNESKLVLLFPFHGAGRGWGGQEKGVGGGVWSHWRKVRLALEAIII